MGQTNTHEKQTIDTIECLAFLRDENGDNAGLAKIDLVILNDCVLDEIRLNGKSRKDFACLEHDVRERLIEAGYSHVDPRAL
jgi:hypothetical protein